MPSSTTPTARRPHDLLRSSTIGDVREAVAALAKSGVALFFGNYASAAAALVDALKKAGLKKDAGELGWLLVIGGLGRAVRAIEVAHVNVEPFIDALPIFLGDATWPLDDAFFAQPARLSVVADAARLFERWLVANGVGADAADTARRKLVDGFAEAMGAEWSAHETTYEAIAKLRRQPFLEPAREDAARKRYHDSLIAAVEQPLFDETFSLRDIYIPLRGQISGGSRPRVVDAAEHLEEWVSSAKNNESLRVISGEPGSGKSSFVAMFAARLAMRGDLDLLFIPLHLFELAASLETAIGDFAASVSAPADLFDVSERPLLLIFDGVDELEMQGRHGVEVARDFVQRVEMLLGRRAEGLPKRSVLAIVTGREILIQSLRPSIDSSRVVTLMPFEIRSPARFDGSAELLERDQRKEWWQRYGKLKGRSYDGVPPVLDREALSELLSQPLLNYLVAVTYERGRVDFTKEPSVNVIYGDLVSAVYERGWARAQHPTTKAIESEADFDAILEEIAATTWAGNGRTATVADVARRCRARGLEPLLLAFASDAEVGVARFLTAFYFRFRDPRVRGEKTFEFTHKTFGEYLTARWLVLRADLFTTGGYSTDLLREWLETFGDLALDHYLFRFLEQEIVLMEPYVRTRIGEFCVSIVRAAAMYGLPVHELPTRRPLRAEQLLAANAGTMALAFVSLAGRAAGTAMRLPLDGGSALAEWLHEAAGPRSANNAPLVLKCLSHVEVDDCNLKHLDLWGADLSESRFPGAKLDNAILARANLTGCDLQRAALDGTLLRGATLIRTDLTGATIQDANFTEAEMDGVILENAECFDVSFREAKLPSARMTGATLRGCVFERAVLAHADLTGATMSGWIIKAAFTRAVLRDADLRDAIFIECDFEGAVFEHTTASERTFSQIALTEEQRANLILVEPTPEEDFDDEEDWP